MENDHKTIFYFTHLIYLKSFKNVSPLCQNVLLTSKQFQINFLNEKFNNRLVVETMLKSILKSIDL